MREQLLSLRSKMKELGIDVYIVSDKDEHLSEYTDAHFCALKEFSGFSGGDGTLAVSLNRAALWTDGRYFTQAEQELIGSGIELMRQGTAGTMPLTNWIRQELPESGRLGFDGRCVSLSEGSAYLRALSKGMSYVTDTDVCGLVWAERPKETVTDCWLLDEIYSGKSAVIKIDELRQSISRTGANSFITGALDDIAWLLNLRADDIPCNPVFTAYMMVTQGSCVLYSDERHFNADIRRYLDCIGVELKAKDEVFKDAALIKSPVLIDRKRSSYELCNSIARGSHLIDCMSPIMSAKCRKNDIERKNIRIAQHKDSLALTRYMYWFKTVVNEAVAKGGSSFTELSCAERLHELRALDGHFIEESFHTISAYGANAAMAHYLPTEKQNAVIKPQGLYLVDSGGHYYEGTTDATRTWSCGDISEAERRAFTLCVIANLRLADAKFVEGTSGLTLDYAAREVFWRRGMNYNHGTGHGVGFVLNVHESPVGIRYKPSALDGAYPMYEGMYVSDEPGYYEAGNFGVRIENMLMVNKDYANEYGNFCSFETCTLVPFDRDCLDVSLMSDEDISLYNKYQQRVYNELQADLSEGERAWLEEICSPIMRMQAGL